MKKILLWTILAIIILGAASAFLFYNGILLFNNPSARDYPVRGVDVSSYQGTIDWDILAGQNIQFAFIKATEGSGFVDRYFVQNYEAAVKTPLRIGAYHFFSYDSPGETQARNFISAVPKADNLLPPVIDVEFYGDKAVMPPEKEKTQKELSNLISILEQHYNKKPIIYATEISYKLYIAESFADYDIWIRNVISRPSLSDKRNWTFWQYTNRKVLDGYAGKEKYIDMNVFNGTLEEFGRYAQ